MNATARTGGGVSQGAFGIRNTLFVSGTKRFHLERRELVSPKKCSGDAAPVKGSPQYSFTYARGTVRRRDSVIAIL
jgi:hypothetical protein